MRAMRLYEHKQAEDHPLRLEDLPAPEPAAGQVRLKIKFCGVCHTDLHTVEGDIHPPNLPITPGHQVVGVIDALGEDVDADKFGLGDRAGVPWLFDVEGDCE